VLASAVSILSAIDKCYVSQAKKFIRKIIFRGCDEQRGFTELRSDLAHLVESRTDLNPQAVINGVMLQMQVLSALFGEDTAITMMRQAPNRQAFERALNRVKSSLGEPEFQMFRVLLGSSTTREELNQVKQVPHTPVKGQVVRCERKGCNKAGTNRCARCQRINYCSRECQMEDWKTGGHKKVCNKKKSAAVDDKKVQAAAAVAREKASPALLAQERLLAENPGMDYVTVLPSGNQDVGVQLTNSMGKLCFQMMRQKAPGSPKAVCGMYDMLIGEQPDLKEIIRKQLQAEYGVDPLSVEA
jgi:hypothetical protein